MKTSTKTIIAIIFYFLIVFLLSLLLENTPVILPTCQEEQKFVVSEECREQKIKVDTEIIKKQQELIIPSLIEEVTNNYSVATEIWQYLKNLGWNDYVCAGIMGNIMAESGGQTLDIQPFIYSASKNYYGICQWSKKYYPEVQGQDLQYQLQYLENSIEQAFNIYGKNYKKNFDFEDFLLLENAEEAAEAFRTCYERCSILSSEKRKENAQKAYEYFVKKGE